jgi:hypothetical protein
MLGTSGCFNPKSSLLAFLGHLFASTDFEEHFWPRTQACLLQPTESFSRLHGSGISLVTPTARMQELRGFWVA